MEHSAMTRTTAALWLALLSSILLGACGGGPEAEGAEGADAAEATGVAGADADGAETVDDLWAEIEAKEAEIREQTNAPDLDVCGVLDTEALIAAMPATDYNPVTAESDQNMFGPLCRFSGGKPAYNLTARVEASSLSVEEALATYQGAPELPEVGPGVRYYFNPNAPDRRSYVFEARGLTFTVQTTYSDEASSREFARRAVSMIRG